MAIDSVEACQAVALAYDLIKYDARTSIVEISTGLTKGTIRKLYVSIHGKSPTAGQHPRTANIMLKNARDRLQVMTFLSIYKSMYGAIIFKRYYTPEILAAYKGYIATTDSPRISRISFNYCWILARDLRLDTITIGTCEHCGAEYLDGDGCVLRTCPACEIKNSMYCDCGEHLDKHNHCNECGPVIKKRSRRYKSSPVLIQKQRRLRIAATTKPKLAACAAK